LVGVENATKRALIVFVRSMNMTAMPKNVSRKTHIA
jgi:hypothetical protein